MMWGDGCWAGWWVMWVFLGLGTIGFLVLVAVVVRTLWPGRASTSLTAGPDPVRLLDERLARGDVTPEEYQQRRRLLGDGH